MATDPVLLAMLDGTLYELHQLWCDDPDESHDDTADPERAALRLALAIWELMSEAEECPDGDVARAVDLLTRYVAAQHEPFIPPGQAQAPR